MISSELFPKPWMNAYGKLPVAKENSRVLMLGQLFPRWKKIHKSWNHEKKKIWKKCRTFKSSFFSKIFTPAPPTKNKEIRKQKWKIDKKIIGNRIKLTKIFYKGTWKKIQWANCVSGFFFIFLSYWALVLVYKSPVK